MSAKNARRAKHESCESCVFASFSGIFSGDSFDITQFINHIHNSRPVLPKPKRSRSHADYGGYVHRR